MVAASIINIATRFHRFSLGVWFGDHVLFMSNLWSPDKNKLIPIHLPLLPFFSLKKPEVDLAIEQDPSFIKEIKLNCRMIMVSLFECRCSVSVSGSVS